MHRSVTVTRLRRVLLEYERLGDASVVIVMINEMGIMMAMMMMTARVVIMIVVMVVMMMIMVVVVDVMMWRPE